MMLINLKSVLNYLKKNISHSIINILGLATGLLFFFHLLIYINHENEYDSFIKDYRQIYRINYDITQNGESVLHSAKTPRRLFRVIKQEVPEVEYSAMAYVERVLVNYNGHLFSDQGDLWVEGDFAEIFDLEMVKGVATLNDAWKCIISESKAHEIFGSEDPIGKVLRVNEGMLHEITGVYKDLPSNSHVKFDYFMPIRTWVEMGVIPPQPREDFTGASWWTYIKLKDGADRSTVEKSLDRISEKYLTHLERQNRVGKFTLQPLKKLHFSTDRDGELGVSIREKTIDALYLIALLILIVIWLNYINLSTALARKRVDVLSVYRKIGAGRFDMIKLSLIEGFIINISALALAVILYFLTSGLFSKMINIPVSDGYIRFGSVIAFASFFFCAGTIISAILSAIPALRVNPALTHQNKISKSKGAIWLVGIQFFFSCFLIACSLVVSHQIDFMQNAELGVNLNDVVVLQGAASTHSDSLRRQHFNMFREEVLRSPYFSAGTASMNVPGQPVRFRNSNLSTAEMKSSLKKEVMVGNIDDGYIETYGLNLLAGRNFSQPFENDTSNVIVSRSVCDLLGFDSPDAAIGNRIRMGNNLYTVKGVVNDFHHEGLKKPEAPIIFTHVHPFEFGYYSFRMKGDEKKALEALSSIWPKHYPDDPMNYFMSTDFFNNQYDEENRLSNILTAFTLFSIIITAVGLFGLISFFTQQRTREIGLRKVNGATVGNIMMILFSVFLRFEALAFVISCPFAWIIMQKWLQGFVSRTPVQWWIFVVTGFIAFGISIFSVASQSYLASIKNPAESLMCE
jgi:putative ABC transport system permease protein